MIEQSHNAAPFILSYTYVYIYLRFLLCEVELRLVYLVTVLYAVRGWAILLKSLV